MRKRTTCAQAVYYYSIAGRVMIGLCAAKNKTPVRPVYERLTFTPSLPTFVLNLVHPVLCFLTEVSDWVVHNIHSTYKEDNKINIHKLLEGAV